MTAERQAERAFHVGPGELRTSPFLQRAVTGAGPVAIERVTGRTYALDRDDERLLDLCGAGLPSAALAPADRERARLLAARLLLLDAPGLRGVGALTLHSIDLEVAGACNAECVFCPREALRSGRGVGVMREATFERVLSVFGPYLTTVGFVGIGEPTLHRGLPGLLRALTDRGVKTTLVTNGSLLTDPLIAALLESGLGSIQVSFTGHKRETYEEHMLGLDFEQTRARVERLLAAAKGRIPVYISAVETSRNRDALAGFLDYWRERGALPSISPCHSRGGTIVDLLPLRAGPPRRGPARCGLFNTHCFVSWDGKVLACCHDIQGATVLGDVHVDDAAALIGRKLEVMRGTEWFPLCEGCDEPNRDTRLWPGQVPREELAHAHR